MRKKIFIIIILIIVVPILIRFISMFIFSVRYKPVFVPPKVKVQTVKNELIFKTYESSARVEAINQVDVVARVSGTLLRSYFKEGSFVKAGQTLFLIEPSEYQNASDISGADIANIRAKLSYANKQLARAQELVKQDYIAKSKYDEILSQRDSLLAQLRAAKSDHRDKQRYLSYTNVKAPISGKVGTIDVSVGNFVSPSSSPLTTIYSTNPIYVNFSISAEDFTSLNEEEKKNLKHKVELTLPDGQNYNYDGEQNFFDNKVDKDSGSIKLRATFPNPENTLLHGEFVKAKIYANTPESVPVVPMTAVESSQQGSYVYRLDKNNLPQITFIKTGEPYGKNWIVKSGLKAGDRVITAGVMKVVPNKPVEIVN